MKNILLAVVVLVSLQTMGQQVTERIKLNQLGFYPTGNKLAVVTGATNATTFYITSTNLSDTFFTGHLSNQRQSKNSSTVTRLADFSPLRKEGSFVLLVPGVGHSYVFSIGNNVLKQAAIGALKGFYYQRASSKDGCLYL